RRAAASRRVVIATPSLTATLGFFTGLLQGDEVAGGEGWVELAWPGGGRVKLEDRPGRPPGVDRLEADVVGDGPLGERTVAGTRLLLEPRESRRSSRRRLPRRRPSRYAANAPSSAETMIR